MPATDSSFFSNLVKTFSPKVPGGIVYSEDMNEATNEIEGVETVLGTGLRTRTVVGFVSATTSFATLTARLNMMDAGIRSTDVNIHPQYAVVSGTTLQPASTSLVPLNVINPSGSTQSVAVFTGADGGVPLRVNNTALATKSQVVGGTVTINSASAVSFVVNTDSGYTGDVVQVFKGASKTAFVQSNGDASVANLAVSGALTLGNFTNAQHDHTSAAQGGRIFPAGVMMMWAGPSNTVPAGWLRCDGSAVSRTTFSELFAAISTVFGTGDGSTTFNLPDLRSRFPMGSSSTPSGGTGGTATSTLSTSNLPAHTHTINHDHGAVTSGAASSSTVSFNMTTGKESGNQLDGTTTQYITDGTGGGAGGTALSGTMAHTHAVNLPSFSGSTGSLGSGTSFDNLPPYVTAHYIIKV